MRYPTKCKICGGPAVAEWDDNTPQEPVDAWLPMVTCNRCWDLRNKRNESGALIMRLCWRYGNATPSRQGKMIAQIRQSLLAATRAYAEAIAGILKAPQVMWTEDFVDMLIEQPQAAAQILKQYREQVRKASKRGTND